jgi:hypothetical protein
MAVFYALGGGTRTESQSSAIAALSLVTLLLLKIAQADSCTRRPQFILESTAALLNGTFFHQDNTLVLGFAFGERHEYGCHLFKSRPARGT